MSEFTGDYEEPCGSARSPDRRHLCLVILSPYLRRTHRLAKSKARFLCVVPDPHARFPCARHGEVGLEEAYTLATRVREVMEQGKNTIKRPIIAIVDVKSQAYGRREETAAIFLAVPPQQTLTARHGWQVIP